MKDKTPPHNDNAERAFLCCMLHGAVNDYGIEADDFYSRSNMRIFETINKLIDKKCAPNKTALLTELEQSEMIEEAGGTLNINFLCDLLPSNANAEYYAGVISECALKRSLMRIASKIARSVGETQDTRQIINGAIEELKAL